MDKKPPWEQSEPVEQSWAGRQDWSNNKQTGGYHPGDPRGFKAQDAHALWVRQNQRLDGQRWEALKTLDSKEREGISEKWKKEDAAANKRYYGR